jgi:CheY-like chemotaxis protein
MSNVLLVEDELWLGQLYRHLLSKQGHSVRWCQDGYDAIDAIDQQKPSVMVLDLLLPWANGLQLLHELASHADLADIPIIICSNALPKHIDAEAFRAYGVRRVLDKTTMQPRDLVRAVQEVG